MNCPNCGSSTLADQQFCRSCGAGLTVDEPRRFNVRAWGMVVLMMVFGGLLMSMSGKLFDLRWLIFAGVFVMVGGMFLIAAYALHRELKPRKRKAIVTTQPDLLDAADTTNKLRLPVGNNDYVPSVVEATTNLLEVPAQKRPVSSD